MLPSQDIIRPKSITLFRRDALPEAARGLNAQSRIANFLASVSLVAEPNLDVDKFRPDAVTAQKQTRSSRFTQHPVSRGNLITDSRIRGPNMLQFNGVITETPIIPAASVLLGNTYNGASRVDEQIRQLTEFYEEAEPLFVMSSIASMPNMVITNLQISKDNTTGQSVMVSIAMQELVVVRVQRGAPLADSFSTQLGSDDVVINTSTNAPIATTGGIGVTGG